ncbi:rRNA maturation RNase YbeY [Mesobacillus selenatarsenatis]|uniref:Endoribonuclease YbeY n=1 Tax=Mesobacillus selenatarsenatis (strain DSM 18680 / JCM 14380 / FERM P-15431 / SF-1) TaxID=1321606 RepID=A0A0A8X5F2_MESS1|nr:rRNA maturation RNase YbeY [Mesobacillus selenatarsenatis]GAM15215.1 metal-dependent hydrolase YbeY, involved in rRNA and/or ribosome maturation and assembly [Mesobacillus selenatarsenatis SF-1]
MSIEIDFLDEINELKQEEINEIEKLLNYTAEKENVQEGSELSVTFVSNERIQEINREYRDKDRPTDVISFALEEMGEGELEIVGDGIPRILGDIIISIPKAREQAEEYNHSFMRELGFLAVHGLLHLLGYDHMNEQDEKQMFDRQKEILDGYGLGR